MSAVTRRAWAANLIQRAGGEIPIYGSPEWQAMPDGPEKVASCVRAAEAWATDGDDLERRLRTEVLALSRAHKQADDAEYVRGCESWAKTWQGGVHHPDPSLPAEIEAEFWDWVRGAVA